MHHADAVPTTKWPLRTISSRVGCLFIAAVATAFVASMYGININPLKMGTTTKRMRTTTKSMECTFDPQRTVSGLVWDLENITMMNVQNASATNKWVVPCESCSLVHTCRWGEMRLYGPLRDVVGLDNTDGIRSLQSCLRQQTLIVLGDSVVRGPILRMIAPLISEDEFELFNAHSYDKLVEQDSVIMYWDYMAKTSLQPFEVRDENNGTMVLQHMIDNHVHKRVWSKRNITFVIGGTTVSYYDDFVAWMKRGCGRPSGCPFQDIRVVVKGARPSRRWNNEHAFTRSMAAYNENKKKVLSNGHKFVEDASITRFVYHRLRNGDSTQCGCHFCSHDLKWQTRDKQKGGVVCATMANMLAAQICG